MGLSIEKSEFTAEEFERFAAKVRTDLSALSCLLQRPDFGEGESSIGAEVEFYIVTPDLRVQPINTEIAARVQDPQLTLELNRFNLEYNLSPQAFKGDPFARTEQELLAAIGRINQHAASLDGELVPIGILPTLRQSDMDAKVMTDVPRYHALSNALLKQRGEPFSIHIGGKDVINLEANDVYMEGANTSFQLHWRVPAHRFADYFNAIQLVTPIALALASNSPSLFGHHLWDETRIALFKQSIDSRSPNHKTWRHPPRVYYGNGWVRNAWELFAASASLYPPIIPLLSDEDPMAVVDRGEVPELAELRLHQGTTWPWNRAIFDHTDGGHLRIEIRSMPAGPTAVDMCANGLFVIGAALAVLDDIHHLTSILPFHYTEHNFYRAAKYGIGAEIIWPHKDQVQLQDMPLLTLAKELLPRAREALQQTAVDETEIHRLLEIIEGRIETAMSGARWQRHITESLFRSLSPDEAFRSMLALYMANQKKNIPLHEWTLSP
ncbi:glutamate-cysteine ligase family protein [Marinobacterium maritimum]|uniref:Glutamate-cysteine ligase family protein n=1 Tax=Marinobacterium maritimum TaxID=500162 RepID=A0ABP3TB46_9GAMM